MHAASLGPGGAHLCPASPLHVGRVTGPAKAVRVQVAPGLPNHGVFGCLRQSKASCVTSEDTGVGRSG